MGYLTCPNCGASVATFRGHSCMASRNPVAKEPEASGHNRSVMNPSGPDHRGSSRVGAGRTAQDSPRLETAGAVAIQKRKPGRPKVEGLRPWETEGISRRTWYRRNGSLPK